MSKKTTVSMSAADFSNLKEHAKAHGRTLSGTIRLALSRFYEERGAGHE